MASIGIFSGILNAIAMIHITIKKSLITPEIIHDVNPNVSMRGRRYNKAVISNAAVIIMIPLLTLVGMVAVFLLVGWGKK